MHMNKILQCSINILNIYDFGLISDHFMKIDYFGSDIRHIYIYCAADVYFYVYLTNYELFIIKFISICKLRILIQLPK